MKSSTVECVRQGAKEDKRAKDDKRGNNGLPCDAEMLYIFVHPHSFANKEMRVCSKTLAAHTKKHR